MSSSTRSGPTVSSVGRLMVLLVALAGLFAMHGLSDHGVAGPSDVASAVGMHAHPSVGTSGDGMAVGDARVQHQAGSPGHQPHGDHDVTGMCLAVLVALLLLGLVLWRRVPSGLSGWLAGQAAQLGASVRERVPRPPDRFALSILRC